MAVGAGRGLVHPDGPPVDEARRSPDWGRGPAEDGRACYPRRREIPPVVGRVRPPRGDLHGRYPRRVARRPDERRRAVLRDGSGYPAHDAPVEGPGAHLGDDARRGRAAAGPRRGGSARARGARLPGGRACTAGAHALIEISGTELRRRVAAGEPVRYLVPDAVAAYIGERGLYSANVRLVGEERR